MFKRSFVLLLVAFGLTFASIPELSNDSIPQSSTPGKHKYSPLPLLFLGGFGYTSTNRFEFDIFHIPGLPLGTKLFNIDRLLVDQTIMRFDMRFDRTEDDKEIGEFSFGSARLSLGCAIINMATPKNDIVGNIITGGLWLSSGTTKFILTGNNVFGVSLAESHTFEWFLRTTTYNEETSYSFKEVGFLEEVGIQFSLFLANVTAGASFEITNKQRNIGWFVKIIAIPIPMDGPMTGMSDEDHKPVPQAKEALY